MHIFRFQLRRQLATHFKNYTMDSMLMKHSVTGDEMWLVNKVDKLPDEEKRNSFRFFLKVIY